MTNLEKILERLALHGVEFVVIGGYAAMVHGVSFITRDVDVCTPLGAENLRKIHAALADFDPLHREFFERRPFELTTGVLSGLNDLYLKTTLGQVDFLGSLGELGGYEFAKRHSVIIEMEFGACRFLDCATLIQIKESLRRPKDLIVVQQLRAILEAAQKPNA